MSDGIVEHEVIGLIVNLWCDWIVISFCYILSLLLQITFSPALSREFRPYKPDPAPLLHICSVWDVQPDEVMMVGDSLKDDVCNLIEFQVLKFVLFCISIPEWLLLFITIFRCCMICYATWWKSSGASLNCWMLKKERWSDLT